MGAPGPPRPGGKGGEEETRTRAAGLIPGRPPARSFQVTSLDSLAGQDRHLGARVGRAPRGRQQPGVLLASSVIRLDRGLRAPLPSSRSGGAGGVGVGLSSASIGLPCGMSRVAEHLGRAVPHPWGEMAPWSRTPRLRIPPNRARSDRGHIHSSRAFRRNMPSIGRPTGLGQCGRALRVADESLCGEPRNISLSRLAA